MGKYLTNFKTKEEFNSFKDSSNYIYPNISYIEDSGSVINKSPQIQEKQVEITENGEITITPDAGFAYLNKVSVKINVAGSGEGGSEGGSTWRYYDASALDAASKGACVEVGMIVKTSDGAIMPIGTLAATKEFALIVAFSIDEKVNIRFDGQIVPFSVIWESYEPLFLQMGVIEITKEEFYTL